MIFTGADRAPASSAIRSLASATRYCSFVRSSSPSSSLVDTPSNWAIESTRPTFGRALSVSQAEIEGSLTPSSVASSAWVMPRRSEEHTSELKSLMRHSYAVMCLYKTKKAQATSTAPLENNLSAHVYHADQDRSE